VKRWNLCVEVEGGYVERNIRFVLKFLYYSTYCHRMNPREIGWEGVDWMHLAQDMDQWRAPVTR